jgi:2-keto-3-deoxy-galactonokinase
MRFDEQSLWDGVEDVERRGFTRALMMPRLMHQFLQCTAEQRSSYLEGMLVGCDLMALRNAREMGLDIEKPIVLVGNDGRCKAYMAALTRANLWEPDKMTAISDRSAVGQATVAGVLRISRAFDGEGNPE